MSVFAEFSLPVTALQVGPSLAAYPDVRVEVERVVPTGGSTHYLWLAGGGAGSFVDAMADTEGVAPVEVVDDLTDRSLVRVHWTDAAPPLLSLVDENGATLVDATGDREGWTVHLRFPDKEALSSFYEACDRRGIEADLLSSHEAGAPGTGDDHDLTPVQRETLVRAFRDGYFEVPRRTTISDLAAAMDVSEQAVSERLRRALAGLLAGTIDEPSSGGD